MNATLGYRPPMAWRELLSHLAARATPGVEDVAVEQGVYRRTMRVHECAGVMTVRFEDRVGDHAAQVTLSPPLAPVRDLLLDRIRRLFDLELDPALVATHLSSDATLAPLVARHPGLRVPGAIDGFELVLRTILGQQVSVRGATTLAGRLVERFGEPLMTPVDASLTRLAVTAERLADTTPGSIASIGIPASRAAAIHALAVAATAGELHALTNGSDGADPSQLEQRLLDMPGIGPWTASYVLMRGLRWADAFPEGDLVLRKAMGGAAPSVLRRRADAWRPWRAYAAQYLWTSMSVRKADPSLRSG